jgi:hypothetical protein
MSKCFTAMQTKVSTAGRLALVATAVATSVLTASGTASATPTVGATFNFIDDRGANPVHVATGIRDVFGANDIQPFGAGITVTATTPFVLNNNPATVVTNLFFEPFTETQFNHEYVTALPCVGGTLPCSLNVQSIPFLVPVQGAWTIKASDGVNVGTATTNALPNQEIIPLAVTPHAVGSGLTPTIAWTLPDLTGLGVNSARVRVWNLDHLITLAPGIINADIIFDSPKLDPTATSFDLPAGVLAPGGHYSFDVILDQLVTPDSGPVFLASRSEAFTGAFTVPEPPTLAVMGLACAVLALIRRRRTR